MGVERWSQMLVKEKHTEEQPRLKSVIEAPPIAQKSRKPSLFSKPVLSLELGDDYIVWSLHKKTLHKTGLVDHGILVKKDMHNPKTYCEYLNRIIDKTGLNGGEVNLFLSRPGALLRSIYIPVVPGNELKRVVVWECNKVFPFPVDKTLFDWKIVNCIDWGGSKKYEVQCAAIPRKEVLPAFELLRSRGLTIQRISLIALAWQDLIRAQKTEDKKDSRGNLALARLVGNDLYVLFFHRYNLEFIHKSNLEQGSPGGGFEESLRYLDDDSTGRLAGGPGVAEIDYNMIARNISDSMDYYYGQYAQRSIEKVLISFPQNIQDSAEVQLQEILSLPVASALSSKMESFSKLNIPLNLFMPSGFIPKKDNKALNLVPSDYRRAHREKYYFGLLATLSGLALACLLIFTFLQYRQQRVAENTRATLAGNLIEVQNTELADKISQLQIQQGKYSSALKWLSDKPTASADLLRALSVLTPEEIYFKEVNLVTTRISQSQQQTHASVTGYVSASVRYPEIILAEYVNSLKAPGLFANVGLKNRDTGIESAEGEYEFRIEMELN
jgi:Tfp pilus assembly protein PilN